MEATTGGLFHDPSSGIASSVLPKFHPGFRAANAAEAVIGVKVPVQDDVPVAEAELNDEVEDFDVEEDFEEVLVWVDSVVATDVAVVLAVPGTH